MRPRRDDFHPEATTLAWSALDRDAELAKAQARPFDLIILGGGITGAGLAREAALRGLRFLLVEQADFAEGTSSRSSKLIHGGLRYLPQGRIHLVRESVLERNWLARALPHLVRPLAFHYAAFDGTADTPLKVRAGLFLYQALAGLFGRDPNPGPIAFLTPAAFAREEPGFRREGLKLVGRYHDAATDDARLVIETLKEARNASGGRSVILNHARGEAVLRAEGRVTGLRVHDRLTGRTFEASAPCVVNATGVWAAALGGPDLPLRPTKGVHLVVPRARLNHTGAFALRSVDDGRFVFVLPRGEISLVGTTDTDHAGDLADPRCGSDDAAYLLRTVNAFFPEANLTGGDVLATYAGLRPLVQAPDEHGARPSDASREHVLHDDGLGLVSIAGGKLTTFRRMGWEVLAACTRAGYVRRLRGAEGRAAYSRRPYACGVTWTAFLAGLTRLGLRDRLPEARLQRLHQKYGHGAVPILQRIAHAPALGEPFVPHHPLCPAEVDHLVAFEQVPHLADLLVRRTETHLALPPEAQGDLARAVAARMGLAYGWSEARQTEETGRYLHSLQTALAFRV